MAGTMTYAEIREAAAALGLEHERAALAEALATSGYNISRAAASLECSFSTLRRSLGRHPDLLAKCGGRGRPKR